MSRHEGSAQAICRGIRNQRSGSAGTAISGDGMNVVFQSYADSPVQGDNNEQADVFR